MSQTKTHAKGALILVIGTGLAGVFSYLYNTLSGRLLGPALYAEVTAILGILTLATVVSSSITLLASRFGTSGTQIDALIYLAKKLGIATGAGVILASPFLNHWLGLSNALLLVLAALYIIPSFITAAVRGILQNQARFTESALVLSVEMVMRVAMLIIATRLGFSLTGAVAALMLGSVCSWAVALLTLRRVRAQLSHEHSEGQVSWNLAHIWPLLVMNGLLITMLSLDTLLAKYLYSPEIAGTYASVATIAKIITFIGMPISTVLFSTVVTTTVFPVRTVWLLVLANLASGILIVAGYTLLADPIVHFLYGNQFTEAAQLLPRLGVYMLCYSLAHMLCHLYAARDSYGFLGILVLVLAGEVGYVLVQRPDRSGLVSVLVSTTATLLGLLILYLPITYRHARSPQDLAPNL